MTSSDRHEILDAIREWPDLARPDENGKPLSELDASQLDALHRILTKRLAVIQGPPGTGKTYISVMALHVMLKNMTIDDPPIIVSAHTNHALDQLLRHVAKFEPRFVRLGGQTLDKEIIEPRTLQKIRDDVSVDTPAITRSAIRKERSLASELQALLYPLTTQQPFSPAILKSLDIIDDHRQQTLEKIERDYVGDDFNDSDDPINIYCGDQLHRFQRPDEASYFNRTFEEYDETMQPDDEDVELEFKDDKFELLHGTSIRFDPGYLVDLHPEYSDNRAAALLHRYSDMSQIPSRYRGSIYAYLQKMAKAKILDRLREIAMECKILSKEFKIGRFEQDCTILHDTNTRIIGMTTTGLSKYRALVSSLKPKVLLIEEAAETLEMYTAVGCMPSLEHLVLVGDHQQLRGHCNVKEFESAPWNLDISLFERLVNNGIEFTQLKMQRRMRPHIREIVNPIYPELMDHPSVELRADIPGMGVLNSCFLHHKFPESNDDALSKQNDREAEFIVFFYLYLVQNGMAPGEITVLTFYNGQRKLILRLLSKLDSLRNIPSKVFTVDSYQGEENEIILLSLTRNNERGQIGFLSVDNRVCVALSRARRGFYLFGDSVAVYQKSPLWKKVLDVIGCDQKEIRYCLPLVCQKHNRTTHVDKPTDFEGLDGGCRLLCKETRPCGHACRLHCHPQPHDQIACEQPCEKILPCGHRCSRQCWYPEHECRICDDKLLSEDLFTPSTSSHRSRFLKNGRRPRITSHVSLPANTIGPPSAYGIGPTGLPETPQGQRFRDFAAGGVTQQDKRMRDQAQRHFEKELAKAAQSKIVRDRRDHEIDFTLPPTDDENTSHQQREQVKREAAKPAREEQQNEEQLDDMQQKRRQERRDMENPTQLTGKFAVPTTVSARKAEDFLFNGAYFAPTAPNRFRGPTPVSEASSANVSEEALVDLSTPPRAVSPPQVATPSNVSRHRYTEIWTSNQVNERVRMIRAGITDGQLGEQMHSQVDPPTTQQNGQSAEQIEELISLLD